MKLCLFHQINVIKECLMFVIQWRTFTDYFTISENEKCIVSIVQWLYCEYNGSNVYCFVHDIQLCIAIVNIFQSCSEFVN